MTTSSLSQDNISSSQSVCICGLPHDEHKVFFAGMITNKPISIIPTTTKRPKVLNHLDACSHPDIQLKCHNREPGYPAIESTFAHGTPSWRWQVLAGPFIDYRANELATQCADENRTPLRRLVKFVQLAIAYNNTRLQQGETPLSIYLLGDVSFDDLQSLLST